MGDGFKPWRWKLGCVTLVMACISSIGWVRSLGIADVVTISTGNYFSTTFQTCDGIVGWRTTGRIGAQSRFVFAEWRQLPLSDVFSDDCDYVWRWCGFGVAERDDVTRHTLEGAINMLRRGKNDDDSSRPTSPLNFGVVYSAWFVPNWSITVPLTLISIWLLLSKPRKSTPKKTDQSIPDEGT